MAAAIREFLDRHQVNWASGLFQYLGSPVSWRDVVCWTGAPSPTRPGVCSPLGGSAAGTTGSVGTLGQADS